MLLCCEPNGPHLHDQPLSRSGLRNGLQRYGLLLLGLLGRGQVHDIIVRDGLVRLQRRDDGACLVRQQAQAHACPTIGRGPRYRTRACSRWLHPSQRVQILPLTVRRSPGAPPSTDETGAAGAGAR